MIAKGSPCPECDWSEQSQQEGAVSDQVIMQEFARRMTVHARNYFIFMLLMFAAGLVSLLTAVMWCLVIYTGDIGAFLMVGVLTVFTGGLNVFLWFSKKFFPVDIFCPACNLHLEDLDMVDRACPSCSARLR
jgi:hypothetical protein